MAGKDQVKIVRKNLKRVNKALRKQRKRQDKAHERRATARPSDDEA